MTMSEASGRT